MSDGVVEQAETSTHARIAQSDFTLAMPSQGCRHSPLRTSYSPNCLQHAPGFVSLRSECSVRSAARNLAAQKACSHERLTPNNENKECFLMIIGDRTESRHQGATSFQCVTTEELCCPVPTTRSTRSARRSVSMGTCIVPDQLQPVVGTS